jgi:hypothetical protein
VAPLIDMIVCVLFAALIDVPVCVLFAALIDVTVLSSSLRSSDALLG